MQKWAAIVVVICFIIFILNPTSWVTGGTLCAVRWNHLCAPSMGAL